MEIDVQGLKKAPRVSMGSFVTQIVNAFAGYPVTWKAFVSFILRP